MAYDEFISQGDELSLLPLAVLRMHQSQLISSAIKAREFECRPEDFDLCSVDEYIDLVIDYVDHLRPDLIPVRFVSQSPTELLIAPEWGLKNYNFSAPLQK
ncbi:radical SAM protein [Bacteroides fragilis]|nr:radical SAM protein [Bacteroides fragilis]